jgi:hypothetical protein
MAENKEVHIRLLRKRTWGTNTEKGNKVSYNLPLAVKVRKVFQTTVYSFKLVQNYNSKPMPGFKPQELI